MMWKIEVKASFVLEEGNLFIFHVSAHTFVRLFQILRRNHELLFGNAACPGRGRGLQSTVGINC